jgi:hypothetical protein
LISTVLSRQSRRFGVVITQRPETLSFAPFLARQDCLLGLFKQTRPLNLHVSWIIERLSFAEPPTIVKYVEDHFRYLRPVVEEFAKTQDGDSGEFLHGLAEGSNFSDMSLRV